MAQPPHVDFSDREDKDGIAYISRSENGVTANVAHEEGRPTEPVELDIADPHFMANAYDTYANLRTRGPMSRVRFVGSCDEAYARYRSLRLQVSVGVVGVGHKVRIS